MQLFFCSVAFTLLTGLVVGDHCPSSDWVNLEGNCYLFNNAPLKWRDAWKDCMNYGAGLVQFYSNADRTTFYNYIKNKRVIRWWTALNDYNHPGAWAWGRKGDSVIAQSDSFVWNTEPDDTNHLENCAAINIQGTLSDNDCSKRHGFMCELVPGDDGCPFGWLIGDKNCYYISDLNDPTMTISWQGATKVCQTLQSTSKLLRLETAAEQTFIRNQLADTNITYKIWWIGMTDQAQEGQWVWDDGSAVNQQNLIWEVEPDNLGGFQKCAVIYNNGRFSDVSCKSLNRYVCQMPQIADTVLKNHLGCPINFQRAGRKCYFFQRRNQVTWSQADTACTALSSELLHVDTPDEKLWLEIQMTKPVFARVPSFWSGLHYHTNDKSWHWSTEAKANSSLVKWNSEPNNFLGEEDCGLMSQDGVFNDMSCFAKMAFICEMDTEDVPCPYGWISTNSISNSVSCYYFSNSSDSNLVTWKEAQTQCQQLGLPGNGYLLALNNLNERKYILATLKTQPAFTGGWWTGLNDQQIEGIWTYDTTFNNPVPLNLIIWDTQPNNSGGKDYCAIIYYGGRYDDIDCGEKSHYICERNAQGVAGAMTGSNNAAQGLARPSQLLVLIVSMIITSSMLTN